MSMQDPIADMITRIRNAGYAGHPTVVMPASRTKEAIALVLKDEGYIGDYRVDAKNNKKELLISLKYFEDAPVIKKITRISKPGLRIYRGENELPRVMSGLGVAIISTSQGIMSDRHARAKHVGGEVLCEIE